jgi:hypothetical protein
MFRMSNPANGKWSVELRTGRNSTIQPSLNAILGDHDTANTRYVFVSEGGTLLNEPDQKEVTAILPGASPGYVIDKMTGAIAWAFERFEDEIQSPGEFNYVKVSFVNLQSDLDTDEIKSGVMSTNNPGLPDPAEMSPQILMQNVVKAIAQFFRHVHCAVALDDDAFICDWVSLTFLKR